MRPLLTTTLLCAVVAVVTRTTPATGDVIEDIAAATESTWNDDHTMDVVRFMEPHWRLPGNTGFDASIHEVRRRLIDAGYVEESEATPEDRLTWRLESRPMRRPTWEPIDATLSIIRDDGTHESVLAFKTNWNMITINSWSTPEGGIEATLIRAEDVTDETDLSEAVVIGDGGSYMLHRRFVMRGGAQGVLCYGMPEFNRPETHVDSIPFSRVQADPRETGWALNLSHRARTTLHDALANGPVRVHVDVKTRSYEAEELTIIAEVRGATKPDERFVFSAHVQEPGANDNATGVATQMEMARVAAALLQNGTINPDRTVTFLWGDEIRSTARFMSEDAERAAGVRWGMSLDMVGADPAKTGGSALIEKMPDPSAIWQRGGESFTEWGGRPLGEDAMIPHYLNDFILNRCRERAAAHGWTINTNPYEGGSDHVPFLRADVPAVLMWHFTDEFYHTDGDVLENISPATMRHIGTSSLTCALALCAADAGLAERVLAETLHAALKRLEREAALNREARDAGDSTADHARILKAWANWYIAAIDTIPSLLDEPGQSFLDRCRSCQDEIRVQLDGHLRASH